MAQKSKGKEDLRVLRTHKMLQTALMDLTIQKGFEAVTVHDICIQAMVNRATFYRHYMDKYDLLDHYMEELYGLLDQPQGESGSNSTDTPPVGLIQLLEHLRIHAAFYQVMLGPKGYPLFGERIRAYIEKRFQRTLPTISSSARPGQPPVAMMMRCVSAAGLGAIQWWLENDMPVTPEQMAAWAVQISRNYIG